MAQLSKTVQNLAVSRIKEHFKNKIDALTSTERQVLKDSPDGIVAQVYWTKDGAPELLMNALEDAGYYLTQAANRSNIVHKDSETKHLIAKRALEVREQQVAEQVKELSLQSRSAQDAMYFHGAEDALQLLNSLLADTQESD